MSIEERIKDLPRDKLEGLVQKSLDKVKTLEKKISALQKDTPSNDTSKADLEALRAASTEELKSRMAKAKTDAVAAQEAHRNTLTQIKSQKDSLQKTVECMDDLKNALSGSSAGDASGFEEKLRKLLSKLQENSLSDTKNEFLVDIVAKVGSILESTAEESAKRLQEGKEKEAQQKSKADEAAKRTETLRVELSELQKESDAKRVQQEQLTHQLKEIRKLRKIQQSVQLDKEELVAEKKQLLKTTENELQSLEAEFAECQKANEERDQQNAKTVEERRSLQQLKSTLDEKRQQVEEKNENLAKILQDKANKKADAAQKIEDLKKKSAHRKEALESQIASKKDLLQTLQSDKANMLEVLEKERQNQLTTLEKELSEAQAEVERARMADASESSTEMEDAIDALVESNEEIRQLKTEIEESTPQLNFLRTELQSIRAKQEAEEAVLQQMKGGNSPNDAQPNEEPFTEYSVREMREKSDLVQRLIVNNQTLREEKNLEERLEKDITTRREAAEKLVEKLKDLYGSCDTFNNSQKKTIASALEKNLQKYEQHLRGPTVPLKFSTGLLATIREAFQSILEDSRERVRALGQTNKVLQFNISEKKTANKTELVNFLDDQKQACIDVQNELDTLTSEIEKEKRACQAEKEAEKTELEKMGKYKQIMDQAGNKLKVNEKKTSQLHEQLAAKQEEHVSLQEELDRVKKADQEFFGTFASKEVQLTVEVEVMPLVIEKSEKKEGESTPSEPQQVRKPHKEVWCMLRDDSNEEEEAITPGKAEKGKHRLWWKKTQLLELMGAGDLDTPSSNSQSGMMASVAIESRIPPTMQSLIRKAACRREEEVGIVRKLKDERSLYLRNLVEEYEKYKRKAATVAKIQASQSNGPVEGKMLEQVSEKNQAFRQKVNALSLEIQKIQQSNAEADNNIAMTRNDILQICDALTQKQSQSASLDKKKADLETELAEKAEEATITDKYWRDEEKGRKRAMEQEVDILRTLAKNLEMEIKNLKDRYETVCKEKKRSNSNSGQSNLTHAALNGHSAAEGSNGLGNSLKKSTSKEGQGKQDKSKSSANPSSGIQSQEENIQGKAASASSTQASLSHGDNSGGTPKGADGKTMNPEQLRNNEIANLKLNLEGIGSKASTLELRDDGSGEGDRKPTLGWSDIMELRALIRQYEQCIDQEKRDEELLKTQNEHLIQQLQEMYATSNLKHNVQERTQMEYIRHVFRQFLENTLGADEHEQCIPVLLKFLEFDLAEQSEIIKKRTELRKSQKGMHLPSLSDVKMPSMTDMPSLSAASAQNAIGTAQSALSSGKKIMESAMQGHNPFRGWF